MKIIKISLIALATAIGTISCNRYLDITPTGKVIPQTKEDFRAMLTRAYGLYPKHKAYANLKSDEVKTNSSAEKFKAIFTWEEASLPEGEITMPYESFYEGIFFTNYIINNAAKTVPSSIELNQIVGEAYALRAYFYFELTNLYAPHYNGSNGAEKAIPLTIEEDIERDFPKASLNEIYSQIFKDIDNAEKLLNQPKFDVGYNYRFTSTALHAFKARVHQYRGEWSEALNEADKVLSYHSDLEDLNTSDVLPSNFTSKESIMNLDLAFDYDSHDFSLASDSHIKLFDQSNDLRFAKYFRKEGSDYKSVKYSSNDFKVTFRVGEILLIKAEAQAKLNQEQASKETLLKLAEKRYNPTGLEIFKNKISSLNGEAYYAELLNERARETSFEGLRWFDLRRTSQPQIIHQFDGKEYTLKAKDPRYTIPFPKSVKLKNPQL